MPTPTRKRRGAQTQMLVTRWLAAHGFPYATDAGAGRGGRDIMNVVGLAIEVKARRDLSLPSWLRQAVAAAGLDVPVVIHRPDGFGPTSLPDWPVTMRLADWTHLVRQAGYGDPLAPLPGTDGVPITPEQLRHAVTFLMQHWETIDGDAKYLGDWIAEILWLGLHQPPNTEPAAAPGTEGQG